MPQFTNTSDLFAYVRKAIDEALTDDVFKIVQEIEQETIIQVVYSTPTLGYYRRRWGAEGMADEDNIVMAGGSASNGILSVMNVTLPNPYLNGKDATDGYASTAKDLPTVIESGRGYDYWKKPKARPFTAKTIERLQSTNAHKEALKSGLKKRGIPVK